MATVSPEDFTSWRTNSIDLMEEAAQLGILPPQQTALKFWGFHGIYMNGCADLLVLWKIYMLLIHEHLFTVPTLADWCSNLKFADNAKLYLGPNTPEGVWLTAHGSHVVPSLVDGWLPTAAANIWYHHAAKQCLDSPDIMRHLRVDRILRQKQECYLVFGVFSLEGRWLPDFKSMNPEIPRWRVFGFGLNEQGMVDLYTAYFKAIRENSVPVLIGEVVLAWSPRWEIFWEQYHAGTIYSWVKSHALPMSPAQFHSRR